MCFPTFLTLNVTFFKEILITGSRIDLSLQMNLVLEVSNFNYAYLVKSASVKKKNKCMGLSSSLDYIFTRQCLCLCHGD